MPTIKELFHTIANWHNKITVAAGCTKEILQSEPLDSLSKEQLREQQKKLVALFGKIESDAVTANQKVMELKDIIYKMVDPPRDSA